MADDKQPEMVERVALVMARYAEERAGSADPQNNPNYLPYWMGMSRAAIEAMREPTQEMIDACDINIPTEGMITGIWADMMEAALK